MGESSEGKRGHSLRVYLTAEEAERASIEAERRGLSASAWARVLVLEQLGRAGAVPAPTVETDIEA